MTPLDRLGRPLHDLRISVTDRCNFRCTYCMPKEIFGRDYAFLPRDQILSFEEIERAARAFVSLGVEKLRITGGEPLVRRDLPTLIGALAALRTPDGRELDLTLTTNGAALRALARPLADAGLRRVTVSLDSLDDAVFGAMNGIDFPVARVLDGIDAALEAGLTPVKVNMVVRRGVNEYVGGADGPLGARDRRHAALHRIHGCWPLQRLAAGRGGPRGRADRRRRRGLARRARRPWLSRRGRRPLALPRRGGGVRVISSVTRPFCRDCTRARLSADGQLYTCLFAVAGRDVRAVLRDGSTDDELVTFLADTWRARDDRYSELRSLATPDARPDLPKVEMFAMGG